MARTESQTDAIDHANATLTRVDLPSYTELLDLLRACHDASIPSEIRLANMKARKALIAADAIF